MVSKWKESPKTSTISQREGNLIGDLRQGGTIYCTCNGDIKQEEISKNLNIIAFGEGFTCDCIDSDIKEEESSANKDNIGENFNMNKINIKEETTSISHKDNIVNNCLCDNN